ncbi:hypothetical protein CBL_11566 [Carabus blaptoides fortunei]
MAPTIEQREVNLRVGNMLVMHTVCVAEIKDDVILKIDCLRKYGCVIDPVNNMLRFGEEAIMLEDRTEECTIRCRLMCLTDIIVPPMAEIPVPTACTGNTLWTNLMVVKPYVVNDSAPGLLVARTVVSTGDSVISLRIMNMASSAKILNAGTLLAVGEPIACTRALKVVDCDEQLRRR